VKGLSVFDKIVYVLNVVAALLLLAACAVPYISNEKFSFLAFLSLTVPVLVGANVLFLLYWMLKKRKQLRLSLFVLVFGYFVLGTFVKFNTSSEIASKDDLKIMTYNVRNFNRFGHLESTTIFEDVKKLVDEEQPDIICFQESGYLRRKEYLQDYPYQYLDYIYMKGKVLMGMFSKYPIVDRDLICFPDSPNNAGFIDVLYKKDTIRIYNVHLQSLGVTPGRTDLSEEPKDKLFKEISRKFKIQQQQAKMIETHMASNTYKQIVCGDFNNTQFSNVYKTIKGDLQDTFIEKGAGYGRTLYFHNVPLRIDFILADEDFEVKSHKNYDEKYSDHYPVMASFKLKSD